MKYTLAILLFIFSTPSFGQDEPDSAAFDSNSMMTPEMMGPRSLWQTSADCGAMTVYDVGMGMCMPIAVEGMPMKMFMLHGNVFGSRIWEQGPRGRSDYSSTSMVMGDLGAAVTGHNYINVDLMLTAERWTVPFNGYPLLTQIGEQNSNQVPFIDAQHPHSSPIMGMTFSDTISWGKQKDNVKLSFAPRGEVTDGPVAFMHRITGLVNPDAPLGHHIGQDVGHVSSTVFAASLKLDQTRLEASMYNGTEPSPDNVDLPLGTINSFSLRGIYEFNPEWMGMISFARVNAPEADQPDIQFENRYSASVYSHFKLSDAWTFYNTFIYGVVTQYDHASNLNSFGEEFLFRGDHPRIWGRIEVLQRTGAELNVPTVANLNSGLWIGAITLGYTHRFATVANVELGAGGSLTENVLPSDFNAAYGSTNPWSGKIFLEVSGMNMWGI